MELNKSIKKVLACVLSLALVITSITIGTKPTKAADWAFTSTKVVANDAKTQYLVTVEYNACNEAEPDNYWYAVYIDQVDDEHLGIASNDWNWWAEKYSYPGTNEDGTPKYGMVAGRHIFDNVCKTANGQVLGLGETHKIIVVAYERTPGATLEEDTFTKVDSIETEVTIPSELPTFTDEELAIKDMENSLTTDSNLALGKDTFCNWADAIPELTDGNLGTRAQSTVKGDDDYFGVDLGEVKTIRRVVIKWEASYAEEYDIYTSTDGEEYTKAASAVMNDTKNLIIKTSFKAVEARYVKVVQTKASGNSKGYGVSPFEMGVYEGTIEDETTTPEPSTEDTTTAATSELVWTDAVADSKWYTNGNWEYYFGDWNASQGKVAVDSENPNRVAIVATNSLWHDAWGTQIKFVAEGLTPGATYTISYDIIADNNDGKIKTSASDAEIALVAGKQTVSRTDAADENGKLELAVGMGWVGLNNKLIMENLKVVDAEGNEVNPKPDKPDETTTPSDPVETTTPSDPVETTTPSDSDETTAPSKPDETTTPSEPDKTTAAPKKVNVPKVKVKSASKKKASKKVKISLKKVKGAKKYQVQISKTKKFKKVLVKKTVKKAKFTIKSKKIKNKKKLYVRVKAVKIVGGKSYKGKWSKPKKIKIKK